MSRVIAAILLGTFLMGTAPAQGHTPVGRPRTATAEYEAAQAALVGYSATPSLFAGDCDPRADSGCVLFRVRRQDRFIQLKVEDATGLPVFAMVFASDGSEVANLCGETTKPIPSPGGSFIEVWLVYGTCYETPTPSVPTVGTVTATFVRG